jgi:pimeloyl-ACP methyl ester carboxylesterase
MFMNSHNPPVRGAGLLSVGLLVGSGLALAGPSPATALSPTGPAAYQHQTVTWGECSTAPAALGVKPECATIKAPRDWATGKGPDIQIMISRVPATDQEHRSGAVLVIPGGLGNSGLSAGWDVATLNPALNRRRDIVSMDLRGVGLSTPLVCSVDFATVEPSLGLDTRNQSSAAIGAQLTAAKAVADACAGNPLTQYINTWQRVRDLDLIRSVLGERRLDYLGYSLGTRLGAAYATAFPHRTGRLVLDSTSEWTGSPVRTWELRAQTVQRRWDRQFLPWATRNPLLRTYVGATPEEVQNAYERGRKENADLFNDPAFAAYLDSEFAWALNDNRGHIVIGVDLAVIKGCLLDITEATTEETFRACVGKLINGPLAELRDMYRPPNPTPAQTAAIDLSTARVTRSAWETLRTAVTDKPKDSMSVDVNGAYHAERCGDGGDWHTPAWWVGKAKADGPRYPLAGYASVFEPCAYWTAPTRTASTSGAGRTGTLVMVYAELDPMTAVEGAFRIAATRSTTKLVAVDDAGEHGQYLRGNHCVDDLVNGYLIDGRTPPAKTVCAALVLPGEDKIFPVRGPVDSWRDHRPS